MSTPRLVSALVLSFVACFASATARAGETNLRPQFKVGAEARYDMNGMSHNVTKAAMLPDGEMKQVVTQQYRVAFKVTEVQSDFAKVEAFYESIKIDVKSPMPGMTPSFDSAQPVETDADNSLAPYLRPIIGAKITLKVSASGEILDVSTPELKTPSGPLSTIAMQFIDPQAVKSNFAMIFFSGNQSGVAETGATWESAEEHLLAPGATMTQKITYTLSEVNDSIATMTIEGRTELKVTGGQMQGAKLEDSKISGIAMWDLSTGMLKTADIKNFMRITAEPQPGMPMTIEADQARAFRRVN